MADPDTLFIRHPRPWKVCRFPQTYVGSTGYTYVTDANGKRIVDDEHQPFAGFCCDKLVDLINADAPKPFVDGWYWVKCRESPEPHPELIKGTDEGWRNAGWVVGPRIEKPQF